MSRWRMVVVLQLILLIGPVFVEEAFSDVNTPLKQVEGINMNRVERGRYLTKIAGCNDCHTPGYLLAEGTVAEEHWLSGETFGWRGPWGTTYGSNLRIFVNALTEDQWLTVARTLRARPPMPWFNLTAMHDEDLKALYRFIKYLGPMGAPAPAYLPPDIEPKPPYALFPSPLQ